MSHNVVIDLDRRTTTDRHRVHAEAVSAIRRSARRSPGEYWPALTRAGRARLRDRRLSDIRAFADSNGWQILGLHQDLSVRHPVPPLLGAVSAQDELAVAGTWEHWPALVASVLVQPAQRPGIPKQRDLVVQLTTLDTGPLPGQFTAAVHGDGAEVVELSRPGALMAEDLRSWLDDALVSGTLQPGDHMAADEVDLLHTRTLGDGRARIDIEGPLHALASLARLLQADRRPGQP